MNPMVTMDIAKRITSSLMHGYLRDTLGMQVHIIKQKKKKTKIMFDGKKHYVLTKLHT